MSTISHIGHRLDHYAVHDDVDLEERSCEDCGGTQYIHPLTGDPVYGTGWWTCRCDPWN